MAAFEHSATRIRIPASNNVDGVLEIELRSDDRLFVVGANGSGKSALVHHLVRQIVDRPTHWISAHRQTWLESSAILLTERDRRIAQNDIVSSNKENRARWRDHRADRRISVLLFDLVAAENRRARDVTDLIDRGDIEQAKYEANEKPSPFKEINELLLAGNLTIQLDAYVGEEILVRHVGGESFSMAQLSDGERSAILLSVSVLTVDPGTTLLIDEPERHLHRSIIEPFLTALFAKRFDCPFIVSTHELSLPVAAPKARVLLPRSCRWQGEAVESFEIDVLDGGTEMPDDLRIAVLGSRKKILFVEGELRSLDAAIYGLLLPRVTVNPRGSSMQVIRAVDGLRSSGDLHWVHAYGLLDRDDRTDQEIEKLQEQGVFALSVHSAESIYYSSAAVRALARRQAETLDSDAEAMIKDVTQAALESLSGDDPMQRLCARACERAVRATVLSNVPDWTDIQAAEDIKIPVSIHGIYHNQLAKYRSMIESKDLEGLISRYAVRESGALDVIARKLEFSTRSKYEQAVLARAGADADFRNELRALIGPLAAQIDLDAGGR